jgi:hypothetical protein
MAYGLLKVLHILLAIIAVGFSTSFGIIIATSAGNLDRLRFALNLVRLLEKVSRISFIGLLLTGVILGWMLDLGWHTLWFTASLGLSLTAFAVAMVVAVPTLQAQIALVSQPSPPMDELKRLGARSRMTGMGLGLASLTVLFLMVLKPT